MIKKEYFVWLLIAVLGVFCLVGCGGGESKESIYTGNWVLASGKVNGISLTADQLTETIGKITLNIAEEGKIEKKEGIGLDEKGKWNATESGIIVTDVDGTNSVTFTYKDDTLTGTVKGVEVTLKK